MSWEFRPFLSVDASKPGITIATLSDDRSPYGQWRLSHQYYEAAVLLADAEAKGSFILLPTHLLICHSAELALKAFLLTCGYTLAGLQKPPLNHDLTELLRLAIEGGLPVEEGAAKTLRTLAQAATNFYFRYGAKDAGSIEQAISVHIPPVADSMSAILHIGRAVAAVVTPARS